jgi:hypothetical protein
MHGNPVHSGALCQERERDTIRLHFCAVIQGVLTVARLSDGGAMVDI